VVEVVEAEAAQPQTVASISNSVSASKR